MKVREWLKENNLTQTEVAQSLGMSRQAFWQLIQGSESKIRDYHIEQIKANYGWCSGTNTLVGKSKAVKKKPCKVFFPIGEIPLIKKYRYVISNHLYRKVVNSEPVSKCIYERTMAKIRGEQRKCES